MPPVEYIFFYLAAAVIVAIGTCREGARKGVESETLLLLIGAMGIAGIIGSKFLTFDFHVAAPGEKSFLGAVFAALLTLVLLGRWLRLRREIFDAPVIPLIAGAAVVRVGCFVAGCCEGVATSMPWGVRDAATSQVVHPVQLYEAALNLIAALVLGRVAPRLRRPGSLAIAGAIALAAIRFSVEPLRASAVWIGGATVIQITLLALIVLCAIVLVVRERADGPDAAHVPHSPEVGRDRRLLVFIGCAATALLYPAFSPGEVLVVTTAIGLAGISLVPAIGWQKAVAAPAAGMALMVPLAPEPDSLDRSYFTVGGSSVWESFVMEGWKSLSANTDPEDCESGNSIASRRSHRGQVNALTVAYRRDNSRGKGKGISVGLFHGTDAVSGRLIKMNEGIRTESSDAVRHSLTGVSVIGTKDWGWLGLKGGGVIGTRIIPDAFGEKNKGPEPIVGVRLGRMNSLHLEAMTGDEGAPGIGLRRNRFGIAWGSRTGDNVIRVGEVHEATVESSPGGKGKYVGARVVLRGYELEPMVKWGKETRQTTISVRKRFYKSSPK